MFISGLSCARDMGKVWIICFYMFHILCRIFKFEFQLLFSLQVWHEMFQRRCWMFRVYILAEMYNTIPQVRSKIKPMRYQKLQKFMLQGRSMTTSKRGFKWIQKLIQKASNSFKNLPTYLTFKLLSRLKNSIKYPFFFGGYRKQEYKNEW